MGKNAAAEYGGESAANRAERERRRKGAQSADRPATSFVRRFPHKPRPPPTSLSAPGVHPAAPLFAHRFCAPAGAKRRAPPGAPFLKGHHKFALWNDTIALRLKNRVAPLFGGGAPKSVGGAKNSFIMRFFALQPFLQSIQQIFLKMQKVITNLRFGMILLPYGLKTGSRRFLLTAFAPRRAQKGAPRPAAPLRGGKSPRAAPRFCGRLLEKNKRGKNSAPE